VIFVRKLQFSFLFLIMLIFLLAGSTAEHLRKKPAIPLLVTHIRVTGHDGTESLSRFYSQPEKTGTLLNYLRWLSRKGSAGTAIEQLDSTSFDITLYYSDGQTRLYRQRGTRYFSRHNQPWERIDPEKAQYLLPILQAMPSDEEPQ